MRSTTLVLPSSRFIGRTAELSLLQGAFTRARLVTLLGPPGAGKTRLALEFSQQVTRKVWFCDLSESKTHEDVCVVVSQALGVSLASGDPMKQLRGALSARDGLFILDNCEQLNDLGALLLTWLSSSRQSHFLLTSRSKLSIDEEHIISVGPLPLPTEETHECDAVRLFLDRAERALYGYHPTQEELGIISSLVTQLDGLPLALELAASRMKVLTAAQIQKNLSRRFLLLSQSDPELTRHTTLRQAIDWSWEMLAAHERAALVQCSLFRGGFSLEAAEGILRLEDAPPVLDVLQSLLDKSLLYRAESVHFPEEARFFLYISVREYAQEKLSPNEFEALLERFSGYFIEEGSRWRFEAERFDRASARDRIEAEKENLLFVYRSAKNAQSALQAALALSPLLAIRGPFRLREALLSEALSMGGGAPALRAAALHQRGIALQSLGKTADAIQSFELARQEVAPLQELALEARILGSIAEHYTRAGKFTEAERYFEEALTKNRASDDPLWEGSLLNNLALLRDAQGAPLEIVTEAFAQAFQIYRKLGCEMLEVLALGNLASAMAIRGDLFEAKNLLSRALRSYEGKGEVASKALALANLGLVEQELGELEKAKSSYQQGIEILQRIGYRTHEAMVLGAGLGLCCQEMESYEAAREAYLRALEIFEEFKNPPQEGIARAFLGSLLALEDKPEEASRALALAKESLSKPALSEALFVLSEAFLLLQKRRALFAQEKFIEADAILEEVHKRIEDTSALKKRSAYIRTLHRILARRIAALPSWRTSIFIASDGSWFSCLGQEKVSLSRRRALPQLVVVLAKKRLSHPGETVSLQELVTAGWPNERLLEQAAHNRLYVAISTLRNLGFRELLISREDGWLLSPETPLFLVSGPS
jgi:predicted ATPase